MGLDIVGGPILRHHRLEIEITKASLLAGVGFALAMSIAPFFAITACEWQPARPRTSMSIFSFSVQFSHSDFPFSQVFQPHFQSNYDHEFRLERSASYPPIPNFVFARVMS